MNALTAEPGTRTISSDQGAGILWPKELPSHLYREFQEPWLRPESRQNAQLLEEIERQMSNYTAQFQAALAEVGRHYILPLDSSVRSFLIEHRSFVQILLEAVPYLRRYFGARAIISLKAPVDELGGQTLYAVVVWPGPAREAQAALARFDEDWWMTRLPLGFGYLTFTYELV